MTFLTLGFLASSRANEFLKAPPKVLNERVSEENVRTSLLSEIEGALGSGSASNRLSQMEAILRPIANALPKNEHGNFGHSAVRYALHRLFVLRHGWVIKGLGPDGSAWSSSSPAGVLKDQVPAYIQELLEERLGGKGLGLRELAVLGATIEHLIDNEAVNRLGAVFKVHALPVTSSLSMAEASEVLDTYMMAFILGENLNNMTLEGARQLNADMPEMFMAWNATQEFVHQVRINVTNGADALDFASLAKTVEAVGEQFGTFQNTECQELKDKLVKIEYRGTGRVRLSDFYKPSLDGSWQFQESVGYLRKLGLLDETDEKQPSVMIANYIASASNCIASSGFYSVCCKDECESLLGRLEEDIGAPDARPATIAALIAQMGTSTVEAPRSIPDSLRQRLDDIAQTHDGMVPLHGRLFAQWMHHAYPRECSYPHMSGTTSAQSPDEWMDESGMDSTATELEMMQYHAQAANATESKDDAETALAVEELMPWSAEEELFVVRPPVQASSWGSARATSAPMRSIMLIAAAGSMAFGVVQTLKATTSGDTLPQKLAV